MAPTTAVCAVMIPVVTDVLLGERLVPLTILGVALAIVAIVLVSQQEEAAESASVQDGALPPGVALALQSGVAIGLFFLALAETDAQAGMWPLVAARTVSVTLFGVIALVSARPLRMAVPVARIAIAAGAIDMGANALYLLATRYGPLSVAVTLSSLYPASTVILARIVLGERPQWVAGRWCGVRGTRGRAHCRSGMTTASCMSGNSAIPDEFNPATEGLARRLADDGKRGALHTL